MKILFVTNYPSPYRVEFFNQLGNLVDLTVLFEEDVSEQKHRDKNWFNTNYSNFNPVFLQSKTIFGKKLSLQVKKYVCDKKYDLIIMTNYTTLTSAYAIRLMKREKIKFAIEIDGGMAKDGTGVKEKIKYMLMSSASWWISSGVKADEYLLKYGARKEAIYRYSFSSLKSEDIQQYSQKEQNEAKDLLKKKLGINQDVMVLAIGQFVYGKGFDILIEAVSKVNYECGVYIVGGEPTEEYLKLLKQYNLNNIYFEGFKCKEILKEYYQAADIFVFPTRKDIWGLVINEAMAFGLPVITTNQCVAGIELIEENKNGYIVEVENKDQLSDKLNYLLNNKKVRESMGEESLKKIKNYTIENMVIEHMKIFEDIKTR